jgi:hypothetical protein
VRVPPDLPREAHGSHRRRTWILLGLIVLIVVLASLHTFATIITDELWFGSVGLGSVWHRLFDVKVGMFLVFGAVFFVATWASLAMVHRLAPSELTLGPEDELVRRYQRTVAPHAVALRTVVALVAALIAASSTLGQWQNYLLYRYAVPFGTKDPQFHRDIGFFVFKLPFLSFVENWAFVSLVVITLVTVAAHYFEGGIRLHRQAQRVVPQVKVHLSVLLAAIALVKAWGYVLARYQLDSSTNGYVQGAGYTDVHARLPALELLVWVSIAAAVVLLVNVRRRGWMLPVLAVGTWAVVAVVAGAIYPALLQVLKVNPAQNALERPYIQRNIAATRAAFGISHVTTTSFAADQQVSQSELNASQQSLNDVRLWDPSVTSQTFTKQQQTRGYYSFNALATDRYMVNGTLTPVVVGVRQVDDTGLPAQGWVNTHLQYTHGYGMIVALANQSSAGGEPVFGVSNVPDTSTAGLPTITQPNVYYGLPSSDGGTSRFVVANTAQPEVDYQANNGVTQESHYHGTGGVRLNSLVTRAAFALRFGDLNLLISNRITPQSRLLMYRDIQHAISTAAPFLSLDSSPYPVIVNGQIDWVQNAYTTTAQYPYSQDANTTILPSNSGIPGTVDYIRNSVVVVTNAYTGKMTFYVVDPKDPIIRTWERVFPTMFTPGSAMPAGLRAHLRYPKDIFMLQAETYGRYHITNPQDFYNAAGAWTLSQDPGAGSPSALAKTIYTLNGQGLPVSTGQTQRMTPLYEVVQLPGQQAPTFSLIDAMVPYSSSNQVQNLAGFMTASSNYGPYGTAYGGLTEYVSTASQSVDGPALVEGRIQENSAVSKAISLLNQGGSSVQLGNVVMVPVGQSMLYFRPLYVQASRNSVPELQDVIAVYDASGGGGNAVVAMAPTLQGAIADVFSGTSVTVPQSGGPTPGTGSGSAPSTPADQQVQSLIQQAVAAEQTAQSDLKAGNFAQYGTDEQKLQQLLQQLQAAAGTTAGPAARGSSGSSGSSSGAVGSSSGSSTGSGSSGSPSGSGSSGSASSGSPSGSGSSGSGSVSAGTSSVASAVTSGGSSGSGGSNGSAHSARPSRGVPATPVSVEAAPVRIAGAPSFAALRLPAG